MDIVDVIRLDLVDDRVCIDPGMGKLMEEECLNSFANTLYLLSSLVTIGGLNGFHEKVGLVHLSSGQYHSTSLPSRTRSS